MASFLKLLFLLFFIIVTAKAQQRQSNISLGASLSPNTNSSWPSNSGLYAFGFYREGNGFRVGIFMAGIPQKTVVWTMNRDSQPMTSNATLMFTSQGRLVLQSTQGQELDIGDSTQPASSASMLDSGNFVLYDSEGRALWQSFSHPTDTLLPSQPLMAGTELVSSNSDTDHSTGLFRLKMQTDGNLVQYPVRTPDEAAYSYYTSWTYKVGNNVTLTFGFDGHLYLMNPTGLNIKDITPGGFPRKNSTVFITRIDPDGIFRVHSNDLDRNGSWEIEWSSSNDKCEPKGVCGLNAFCVPNGEDVACRCLPGFDFVNKKIRSSNCQRNFTADICGNERLSFSRTIEELPNTYWRDHSSYSVLTVQSMEACEQACSSDCNCEVALYNEGSCTKHKLPLRYGKGLQNDNNTALVKVFASKSLVAPNFTKDTNKKVYQRNILIIGTVLVVFGLTMVLISTVLLHRSQFWRYKRISNMGFDVGLEGVASLRAYTYDELEKMTDSFKEKVGTGSFGTVYKGTVLDGQRVVAVKRLERLLEDGDREFQNEVRAIGRIHHKNLVRLLGYCCEEQNRLLVYEYMANGSLADILFEQENRKPSWKERLGISCAIARGILYLHEDCESQMIHCDIKPQNILIDQNGLAKISDFGLTKFLMPDQSRTFTGIRGTRGYVAPEWHKKAPVTVKADIYSFGIVLLEIICCRRNVILDITEEEAILDEWVYNCYETGRLWKLAGNDDTDERELERMVKVALWCIQEDPSLRPSMKNALLMMEGIIDVPTPPTANSFSDQQINNN